MESRNKDRTAAGILAILLGFLGVHHFYLGSTLSGVALIGVSIISCGSLGWIVGLIEGIMILTMTPEDFDTRYNKRAPESFEFVFMKPK